MEIMKLETPSPASKVLAFLVSTLLCGVQVDYTGQYSALSLALTIIALVALGGVLLDYLSGKL